ncbi:MAG: hypothetical protein GYB39_10380 [Algicola sp.]|nr:hypothetical protein [Algicola sp.]
MMKRSIAILFLAAIIAVGVLKVFEPPFNDQTWKNEPMHRYKMAKDVVESRVLIGKTAREVIALLGEPDVSNLSGRHHLLYKLGTPPSFFKENEQVLVVVFEAALVQKVLLVNEQD